MYISRQDQMLEKHQPFNGSLWAKLGRGLSWGLGTASRDGSHDKVYLE